MTNQHTNIQTQIQMYEDTALHINRMKKRRYCNANWKPTRENQAKLQIYDLITTSSLT